MDSVDLFQSNDFAHGVAQLFSQVVGHKSCRSGLSPQAMEWLNATSQTSSDARSRIAATTALIKLSKGFTQDNTAAVPNAGTNVQMSSGAQKDEDLAALLKKAIILGEDLTSLPDAVEGLAYISTNPLIKDSLSYDTPFLKRLFSLVSRRELSNGTGSIETPSTLGFGVLLVASNLCLYRPRLTEEQTQIEDLRRMANKSSAETAPSSVFDDDDHVRARIQRLITAGVLDIFSSAIRSDTPGVRALAGKLLLSIVEEQKHRGRVLQSGGVKVLMHVIKHGLPNPQQSSRSTSPFALDSVTLDATQALAKLTITASPIQVFGPNEGAAYDAIRPFSLMLQSPSSTLLQRFEAMMALTNLSSGGAETATRIAKSEGLLQKVELLLLEDHTLVRRAAMELICNLIAGSEDVFERYGGGSSPSATKSKLQILVALSDVDDLPTRLAATGAVATLTSAPSACAAIISLQLDSHRVFPILTQLIDPSTAKHDDPEAIDLQPHPGLVHRAIVSTRNIFIASADKALLKKLSKEAEDAGLQLAIMHLVKSEKGGMNVEVLRPAVEALQAMMASRTES
ncbi:hypothetical protein H0H93_011433 [Arthromyces matolae]|nr:hypothetical protein H0H93_011433 [Arthromyces matolae]